MTNYKILAVDDEPSTLTLLEKRLQAAGYEVLTATNGKDAIDIARREKPALIVLDILMPGMDGSETASILHEDVKTKDIPILFLTCLYTKREEQVEGHEIGHNFFLAKPYDPKELLDEIHRLIGPR
ncbi:MAG: response regulator [Candidatus Omnitrophota bacterium]|jgi:DNA-binding response OmpR family regulator